MDLFLLFCLLNHHAIKVFDPLHALLKHSVFLPQDEGVLDRLVALPHLKLHQNFPDDLSFALFLDLHHVDVVHELILTFLVEIAPFTLKKLRSFFSGLERLVGPQTEQTLDSEAEHALACRHFTLFLPLEFVLFGVLSFFNEVFPAGKNCLDIFPFRNFWGEKKPVIVYFCICHLLKSSL